MIEARGLKQVRVAHAVGIPQSRLSAFLNEVPGKVGGEFLDRLADEVGGEQARQELHMLSLVQMWRKRNQDLASHRAIADLRCSGDELVAYLEDIAGGLLDAERELDPHFSEAASFVRHLSVINAALSCVVKSVSGEQPIFTDENIRPHLRYPMNDYVGGMMSAGPDRRWAAGLAEAVTEQVNFLALAPAPAGFIPRLIWQHAVHLSARYSPTGLRVEHSPRLAASAEVHDRRIYILGEAYRPSADQSAWDRVMDHHRLEGFPSVVLEFDAAHYDKAEVGLDRYTAAPREVTNTTLQYLAGVRAPDPYQRVFNDRRLQAIVELCPPAMLKRPAIARKVQDLMDRPPPDLSTGARRSLSRLWDANSAA